MTSRRTFAHAFASDSRHARTPHFPLARPLMNKEVRQLPFALSADYRIRRMRALLLIIALAVSLTGCSWDAKVVEIGEPQDVPFAVTWSHQNFDVEEIFWVDERTGWAVGWGGEILFTDDGGNTWEDRPGLPGKTLDGIYFLDKSNGWLATTDGEVFATTDGGTVWSMRFSTDDTFVRHVKFANRNAGWIVFSHSLLATTDGGTTWSSHRFPGDFFCRDAHFVDPQHGWAVGGDGIILVTRDGGGTWAPQRSGVDLPLLSVFFLNEKIGWASKYNGVLWTVDGGETWNLPSSELDAYFASLQFINAQTGWAVGNDGMILRTADGGKSWTAWQWTERAADWMDFETLYFVSELKGWAAGEHGAIFTTDDGGKTWRQQNSIKPPEAFATDASEILRSKPYDSSEGARITIPLAEMDRRYQITQLLMANGTTGWAGGAFQESSEVDPVGVLLSTTDGGRKWTVNYLGDAAPGAIYWIGRKKLLVYAQAFFDNRRSLFRGTITHRAASLKWFRAGESATGEISLQWQVRDEHPAIVECPRLDFSQGTDKNFGPIDLKRLRKNEDGLFSLSFRASEYGIGDGATLLYRVTLDDSGLLYTHQVPESFVYRPWWERQNPLVKSSLIAAAALAVYYAISFPLLLMFPLGSLWAQQRLPAGKMVDLIPVASVKSVLSKLVASIGPHYFSTHERVRKDWLTRFQGDFAALTALSESTRQAFLRHDDVCAAWLAHYLKDRCSLSDLPEEQRQDYLRRPECLDAWIERRIQQASGAYGRLDSVRQRKICIQLPVRVGELAESEYLSSPTSADFRALLGGPAPILTIIGEGGAGKSTLAFQLGRWALSDNVETRLAPYRMIPILLDEETSDLLTTVRGMLTEMVGLDEVDEELVQSLLTHRRLLVIVDGLSERTLDTQRHVCSIHRHASIGALVVTSRKRLDFGATEMTEVRPEKVTDETMFRFVAEYLYRHGVTKYFPGHVILELGKRLMSVLEADSQDRQITPLFVTIFIDQAVELRRQNESLDRLPVSLAETIIEHLRRTNPQGFDVPNRVPTDTLLLAVKVLGHCSLMPRFVPRDLFRDDAERTLREHDVSTENANIVQRLIENGVLEERDRVGTRIVRFVLDPIAEYAAALYRLDKLRDRQDDWEEWADEVSSTEGYPQEMMGFLRALENCVTAYRDDFHLPVLPSKLKASQLGQATTPVSVNLGDG